MTSSKATTMPGRQVSHGDRPSGGSPAAALRSAFDLPVRNSETSNIAPMTPIPAQTM